MLELPLCPVMMKLYYIARRSIESMSREDISHEDLVIPENSTCPRTAELSGIRAVRLDGHCQPVRLCSFWSVKIPDISAARSRVENSGMTWPKIGCSPQVDLAVRAAVAGSAAHRIANRNPDIMPIPMLYPDFHLGAHARCHQNPNLFNHLGLVVRMS